MLSKRRDDTARRHPDERRVGATTRHTLLARSGVSGASGTTPPPSSAPFLGLFGQQPARAARVTAESICTAGASAHASRAARKRSRACQRSAASSVIRSKRRSACAGPRAGEAAGARGRWSVRRGRRARERQEGRGEGYVRGMCVACRPRSMPLLLEVVALFLRHCERTPGTKNNTATTPRHLLLLSRSLSLARSRLD